MGVCKDGDGVAPPGPELLDVPASVLYRPDRRIVPMELWDEWPRIEELAREGLADELRTEHWPADDGLEELARIEIDDVARKAGL